MAYSSGVYTHTCDHWANHAITVVGFGPDYWSCLNSWGTYWGVQGTFKVGLCVLTDFQCLGWILYVFFLGDEFSKVFFWMNIVFIRFYLLKLYHSYDLWLFFTSFCSIHDKPHHLKFPHFRKVFQWESVWWQNQGTVLQFQDIPLIASFAIFDDPSDDKSSFWSW